MDSKVLQITHNCKWVVENSSFVSINEEKIPEYSEFIFNDYSKHLKHDIFSPDIHYISSNMEDTLLYIFALDSINFGSGYFEKAKSEYGINLNYYYVAKALKAAFEKQLLNTPEKLLTHNINELFNIFGFSRGKYEAIDKMINAFSNMLKLTSNKIIEDYKGSVLNFIEDENYSAVKIADTLSEMQSFNDCSNYKGRDIYFLKRAQILPADIDLVYKDLLKDVDKLTIFADNKVPHTFHCDNILIYSEDLQSKIDRKEVFKFGSEEEVEMRAASIHATELMKLQLLSKGITARSVDIDRLLWHRSTDETFFKSKLCHRTETTAY